jgi:hypothetical protein
MALAIIDDEVQIPASMKDKYQSTKIIAIIQIISRWISMIFELQRLAKLSAKPPIKLGTDL